MILDKKVVSYMFLMLSFSAVAQEPVEVRLKVVNEERQPVENAGVAISFLLPRGSNEFRGETDSNGEVVATRNSALGVGILVKKDGYYRSSLRTGYGNQEITLLLREKKNPIAMYAKRYVGRIPVTGQKIGFDFTKGDWTSPYGNGVKNHIFFEFKGEAKDFFNYRAKLTVGFPNENDGILAIEHPEFTVSKLRLPYLAAESGYKGGLEREISGSDTSNSRNFEYSMPFNRSDNFGYFLRVNTEVDKDGHVVRANYVKIRGDIFFEFFHPVGANRNLPTKEGLLNFMYYYNPTENDLNVEFDTNKNLITDLNPAESVLEP